MKALAYMVVLALAGAAVPASAIKGMFDCVGPRGEHYYSDKGCALPDPPPPVPGGTLTLLPGRDDAASPRIGDKSAKLKTHNRYTQRAERAAHTASQHK